MAPAPPSGARGRGGAGGLGAPPFVAMAGGGGGGGLPGWARAAARAGGLDPGELEGRLEAARGESDRMGVGAWVLWRDMRRNVPLAVREASPWGAELSGGEAERAAQGRRDFWPAFWFANIFMNTVPWTPLFLPLFLRVVPARYIVPPQLDAAQDPRIDRLVALRKLRDSKRAAAERAAWGDGAAGPRGGRRPGGPA